MQFPCELVIVLDGGFINMLIDSDDKLSQTKSSICNIIDEPNKQEHKYLITENEYGRSAVRSDRILGFYTRPYSTQHIDNMNKVADSIKKIADSESKGEDWKGD